ncbi:MAG: hypothetical protein EP332_03170 [Bacteroidetes bacterium]|nr:MAG: hypothetical protein EP332_03170 [Bacteroidota bacterium]
MRTTFIFLLTCWACFSANAQSSRDEHLFSINEEQYDWIQKHPKEDVPKSFFSKPLDSSFSLYNSTMYTNVPVGYYLTYEGDYPKGRASFFVHHYYFIEEQAIHPDSFCFKVYDGNAKQYVKQYQVEWKKSRLSSDINGQFKISLKGLKRGKSYRFKLHLSEVKLQCEINAKARKRYAWEKRRYSSDFMLLDKQKYRPYDTLHFAGFISDHDKPGKIETINAEVFEQHYYRRQFIVADSIQIKLNPDGRFIGEFVLPKELFHNKMLTLKVSYSYGKHWFSRVIEVPLEDYNLKSYSNTVQLVNLNSDTARLEFGSFHLSGRAAPETEVEYHVIMYPDILTGSGKSLSFKDTLITGKTTIGLNGKVVLPLSFEGYPSGHYGVYVKANVKNPGRKVEFVSDYKEMDWLKEGYQMKLKSEQVEITKRGDFIDDPFLIIYCRGHNDTIRNLSFPYRADLSPKAQSYRFLGKNTDIWNPAPHTTAARVDFYQSGDSIFLSWDCPVNSSQLFSILQDGKVHFSSNLTEFDTCFLYNPKSNWQLLRQLEGNDYGKRDYWDLAINEFPLRLDFSLPSKARPGDNIHYEGVLRDAKGNPVPHARVMVLAQNEAVQGTIQKNDLVRESQTPHRKYEPTSYPLDYEQKTFGREVAMDSGLLTYFKPSLDSNTYNLLSSTSSRSYSIKHEEFTFGGSIQVFLVEKGLYRQPDYIKINNIFYQIKGRPWAFSPSSPELREGQYKIELGYRKHKYTLMAQATKGYQLVIVFNANEESDRILVEHRKRKWTRDERTSINLSYRYLKSENGSMETVSGTFLGNPVSYRVNGYQAMAGPFDQNSTIHVLKQNYGSVRVSNVFETGILLRGVTDPIYFNTRYIARKRTRNQEALHLYEIKYALKDRVYRRPIFEDFPPFGHLSKKAVTGQSKVFGTSHCKVNSLVVQEISSGIITFFSDVNVGFIDPGTYNVFIDVNNTWYWADSFSIQSGFHRHQVLDTLKRLEDDSFLRLHEHKGAAKYEFTETHWLGKRALQIVLRELPNNRPASKAIVRLASESEVRTLTANEQGIINCYDLQPDRYSLTVYWANITHYSDSLDLHKLSTATGQLYIPLNGDTIQSVYSLDQYRKIGATQFREPWVYTPYTKDFDFLSEIRYKDLEWSYSPRRRRIFSFGPRRYKAAYCPDFGSVSGWRSEASTGWELNDYYYGGAHAFSLQSDEDFSSFRGNMYKSAPLSINALNVSPTPRSNFKDQGLWLPELSSDSSGKIQFDFPVPDDLTTWKVHLFAMTGNEDYLHQTQAVQVSKAFQAELVLPRFLRPDDRLCAPVLFHLEDSTANAFNWDFRINQNLKQSKGANMRGVYSDRVCFKADTSLLQVELLARSGEHQDGVQRTIPVKPKGNWIQRNHWIYLAANSDTALKASFPLSSWSVKSLPSVDSIIAQLQKELIAYKYDCNEQKASKLMAYMTKSNLNFLERLSMYQLLKDLHRNQSANGYWSWWEKETPDEWVTGYVYFVLAQFSNVDAPRHYRRDNEEALRRSSGAILFSKGKDVLNWNLANAKEMYAYMVNSPEMKEKIGPLATAYFHFNHNLSHDSVYLQNLLRGEGYYSQGSTKLELLRWNALLADYAYRTNSQHTVKLKAFLLSLLQGQELNTMEKALLLFSLNQLNKLKQELPGKGHFIQDHTAGLFHLKSQESAVWLKVEERYFDSTETWSENNKVKIELEFVQSKEMPSRGTIRLRIKADESVPYALVEVPLAANMILDDEVNKKPWVSHTMTLHDARTYAFWQIPKGVTEITMPVTLVFDGSFSMPPARVVPMYTPGATSLSNHIGMIMKLQDP